ncbi:MAG: hypothetical protein JKY01_03980 [Pseudomonadales bacterium]|nr:hypothetical protein [Pseudomonadales bacterium]
MYLSSIFLVAFAVLLLLISFLLLLRNKWFLLWLQGSVGIFLFLAAAVFFLFAMNLFSFHSLAKDTQLATLHFDSLGDQHYRVTILEEGAGIKELELLGDMWQIDARVIKWQGWISALGIMPGYQLGRIQGRYLSIEQERSAPRSVHSLRPENLVSGFDLWNMLNQQKIWVPWLDARYGAATFLPMADGAEFSLSLSHTGLLARPLNTDTENAVSAWSF